MQKISENEVGDLVPDPAVCREFGITTMTLWRWSCDPELNFPARIQIRKRNFRGRRQLDDFKARMIRSATAAYGGETAKVPEVENAAS